MAREFKRTDRVAEQMQRELALILQQEIKDPRVGMATVLAVEMTRDLQHAKVFVSFLGIDEHNIPKALKVLDKAEGFIRSTLASRVRMRVMPQLHFVHDTSISRGQAMSSLIEKARSKDQSTD
ncbi:MAG: 30S ribosome-binding factor RbfA [Kangiellaceae bacterium]|jgi:ribosome-binding factor A|nr:30S ribosome-binding factor RbfA [Kangiellaceae bacterium]